MNHIGNHLSAPRKILVAEDEAINRQILSFILEKSYEVVLAKNGQEALDILNEQSKGISLVLLDLLMPVIDGFEVLRRMNEDPALKRIPVIVLTSDKNAEIESLKLGAQDFIVKPYDMPEVILARIRRSIMLAEETTLILNTQKDNLTGLFTKRYFYEFIHGFDDLNHEAVMDAIAINVRRFHTFNGLYGHENGDRLLIEIAKSLQSLIEKVKGLAARVEGDTFFLFLPAQESYDFLVDEVLTSAVKRLNVNAEVAFRIGINRLAGKEDSVERRFDHALRAANQDRHSFENTISFYDEQMHNKELYYGRLLQHFDKAFKEGQFKLYLQPKFNIQGQVPVLSSAEALVRWFHPEYGMVSPGVFVPLFEENGLIRKLDYYIWEEAIKTIAQWKKQLGRVLPISINVSRIDLLDDDLIQSLLHLAEAYKVDIKDIYLEITESAYSNEPKLIAERVEQLSKQGFLIEMDDFGSGYSSLGMVTSLPLDVLKIDMSFVRRMMTDSKDKKMVEIIIEIANQLNLRTVAEGVENQQQLDALRQMGCDVAQGYYFSRPIPVDEFTAEFLGRSKK